MAARAQRANPTVVFVHGAFAESSSWNGVLTELIPKGYLVVAAANPLRGAKSDAAYVARTPAFDRRKKSMSSERARENSRSRIAVITGGSRGLGRNTVMSLARRGVDSIFTYNSNRTEADKVLAEVAATGRKGVALQLDTGKASSFDALVLTLRHALDNLGAERVDYLVNNAGTSHHETIEKTTEESLDTLCHAVYVSRANDVAALIKRAAKAAFLRRISAAADARVEDGHGCPRALFRRQAAMARSLQRGREFMRRHAPGLSPTARWNVRVRWL